MNLQLARKIKDDVLAGKAPVKALAVIVEALIEAMESREVRDAVKGNSPYQLDMFKEGLSKLEEAS